MIPDTTVEYYANQNFVTEYFSQVRNWFRPDFKCPYLIKFIVAADWFKVEPADSISK